MQRSLNEADWPQIERLRERVTGLSSAGVLSEAAQGFATIFAESFASIVLARVFAVVPLSALPDAEQDFARRLVKADPRLNQKTRVLALLGTRGSEPAWNARELSREHRAIPLLDRAFVGEAPMIAKLLADLNVDLRGLDDGQQIVTRAMPGGRNGTFYVPDASQARDAQGRAVIGGSEFVAKRSVKTVFGMGGAYLDGTLVVAILFCNETLDRLVVDRFASLITSFKMATTNALEQKRLFPS